MQTEDLNKDLMTLLYKRMMWSSELRFTAASANIFVFNILWCFLFYSNYLIFHNVVTQVLPDPVMSGVIKRQILQFTLCVLVNIKKNSKV